MTGLWARLAGAIAIAFSLLLAPARATEQSSYVMPSAGPMSMATFVGSYLNPGLRALGSCSYGTSAPANGPASAPQLGQCWLDTNSNPNVVKIYDGASWVAIGSVNTSTHGWSPQLTNGTSGGVPFFLSTGLMGSSLALSNHGVLVGGGAGAAPRSVTAGTDGQLLIGQTSADPAMTTVSGDVTITAAGVTAVGANKIADGMIRQSVALSLVGRSANSTGNVADISAASDFQVMRRSGTSIGFGAIDLSQAAATTNQLPSSRGGTGVNNSPYTITLGGNVSLAGTLATSGNVSFGGAFTTTGAYGLTCGSTCNVTFPTTGTLATLAGSETFTNKTLTSPTITSANFTAADNVFTLFDDVTPTKQLQFQLSGISGSTLRTWAWPDASSTVVGTDTTQTLTNKTLTSPTINTPTISGGTHDALTSLGIRSTGAAFDLRFATAEVLTANRTLSWVLGDANRTISLGGNITTAGAFTLSGAFASTFTFTNTTAVTFPTTGTLATLAGSETFTNKTLTAPSMSAPTVTGLADIQGAYKLSTETQPSQITSNQNNYNPSSVICASTSTLVVTSDAARDLTGLAGAVAGCELELINAGSFTITLKDESASSTAANRFGFGADFALASKGAIKVRYEGVNSRWRNLTGSGTGGGGAGTLTSVATTYPICGGTITTSGTLTYCGPTWSGRLTYTSTTAVDFKPYNGDLVRIAGTVYQIPSAGIAGCTNTSAFVNGTGSSSLGASTFYYVYAFVNSGTVTCDFRTDGNGHLPDSTAGNIGTEVRVSSGTTRDSSRTLIGMVRTNGSSQFVDSTTQRFVVSWYSRRNLGMNKAMAAAASGGTSYAELDSSARMEFLLWSDETPLAGINASAYNDNADTQEFTSIAFNSTSANESSCVAFTQQHTAGDIAAAACTMFKSGLSEGYNYVTGVGHVNAGTGHWTNQSGISAGIRG